MRTSKATLFMLTLGALPGCSRFEPVSEIPPGTDGYEILSAYTRAYNQGDVPAMADLMHEEIQWLSIEGETISVVANGKDDLVGQMTGYISSPSAVTSRVDGKLANGPYLAVREIAQWTNEDGSAGAQSALAIYEIEDGLVRRVWYYPAVR